MTTMTKEQKEMLANAPQRVAAKKPIVTKKRAAIALGILAGGTAAYYIGPKILGKVQAKRMAKAISV